jgi:hypothetical protein
LQERGLPPEAARDVARQTDPDAVRERLEEEGMDPATADRAAREIARENQEQAARERGEQQGEQDARDLSESLRRAAEAMRRQGDQPPPGSREQPEERDNERRDPGGQEPRDPESGSRQQPAPGSGTPEPQSEPGREPGETQREPAREPGGAEPSPPPGAQPGSPAGSPPGGTPPDAGSGQQRPGDRPQPGESPGERPGAGGAEPQPPGGAQNAPPSGGDGTPGAEPDGRSGPSRQGDGDGAGDGTGQDLDRALDALERNLDTLASRPAQAEQRLRDADRLRDEADDLLSRTTPEQRERLSRLNQELARRRRERAPAPAPSEFHTVEAARPSDEAREQVISEWLGEPGDSDGDPAARERVISERVREAAAGAERAVEQQEVPARHADLIRRVFRRYQDRGAPRAEDAPDAPR